MTQGGCGWDTLHYIMNGPTELLIASDVRMSGVSDLPDEAVQFLSLQILCKLCKYTMGSTSISLCVLSHLFSQGAWRFLCLIATLHGILKFSFKFCSWIPECLHIP